MSNQSWNSLQALQKLKQGARIRLERQPVLFRYENKRVLVSASSWTGRLEEEDFLDIYARESFVLIEEQTGIDEKKDEEYYAWRARSQ